MNSNSMSILHLCYKYLWIKPGPFYCNHIAWSVYNTNDSTWLHKISISF